MRNRFKVLTGSRAVKYLLGFLILLVVADGFITNYLISHNIAHESNPFLWDIAGSHWLIIIKIVGAVVCAFVLWDIYRHWQKLGVISIYLFVVVYLVIVGWNISLLFL
ncbi:MAG: DUF5658 family protein [Dehalococcoidales bacterium]|nr:DUF5658 family protein [Dehalococcoidales bacterium]